MKEINIEKLEDRFDTEFDNIDVGSNDKSERNVTSVSFKQILDSYEESKEQY